MKKRKKTTHKRISNHRVKKKNKKVVHQKKKIPKLLQRIHTGIPGLDQKMHGGFLRGSSYLIGGGAGSGKSILCMQFLLDGAKKGEQGIFLSFEETPERIMANFKSFGWDIEKKVKENKLAILYYVPEQVNKVVESGGGTLRDVIEQINAKRIVIDSLTAFAMLYKSDLEQRRGLLNLLAVLHNLGITSLLTSEEEADIEKHRSTIMEFEVDGVILLYHLFKKGRRERFIEVFKMKGTSHSSKMYGFDVGKKGVRVLGERRKV